MAEATTMDDHYGDWNKQRDLEHGKFSYQLILDDGAEEVLIMPTADDAKVLRGFVDDADAFYGDTKHEVLIFRKIDRSSPRVGSIHQFPRRGLLGS